jgi:malonyl-CoA/methylmalonyl-CoA synthetase
MPNPLYDALLAPHRGSTRLFILDPDGRTVTYDEFLQSVARTANAFVACGLEPGDRLALQAEKSVQVLEIYAACILSGVIFLPLNTGYTDPEIDYFLSDARPGLFICDPAREAGLSASAAAHGARVLTLSADGTGSFTDLVKDMPVGAKPASRKSADIAALLYTSGTTGRSKGAMLTQDNLLSNARALQDLWRITEKDRLLHALPVFHAHGLFVAVNTTLCAGASMIFLPGFKPNRCWRQCPRPPP